MEVEFQINGKKMTFEQLIDLAVKNGAAEERERILEIVQNQPYYPDTHTGMRQQWVKDEIIRRIKEGTV